MTEHERDRQSPSVAKERHDDADVEGRDARSELRVGRCGEVVHDVTKARDVRQNVLAYRAELERVFERSRHMPAALTVRENDRDDRWQWLILLGALDLLPYTNHIAKEPKWHPYVRLALMLEEQVEACFGVGECRRERGGRSVARPTLRRCSCRVRA